MPRRSVEMRLVERGVINMAKDTTRPQRSVKNAFNEQSHLCCVHCGKNFIPCRRNHIFCSSRCRISHNYKYQAAKITVTFCLQCGRNLKPTRKWQKFCNIICKNQCNNFIEAFLNSSYKGMGLFSPDK